ncbi:MAG TPA: hypothetical protein PLW86_06245, partial [Rhodocyclaceae bacterium]|nr:hypothetical protein [Rhodocyclaceae bacterium]
MSDEQALCPGVDFPHALGTVQQPVRVQGIGANRDLVEGEVDAGTATGLGDPLPDGLQRFRAAEFLFQKGAVGVALGRGF